MFLYDGDSDDVAGFFGRRVEDFDWSSGRAVHFSSIGDPRVRGGLYERYRSAARAEADEREEIEYDAVVATRGSADHHRRRETRELVDLLGLSAPDLPCIAFLTSPLFLPVPTLRIEPNWVREPALATALSKALQTHLSEEKVLNLGKPGKTTTAELVERLEPILDAIRKDMAFAKATLAEASRGAGPARSTVPLPVPAGTRWAAIRLKFVDGHTIEVTRPGGRVSTHGFAELGFEDRRSNSPTVAWSTLESLAEGQGELRWHTADQRGKLEARIERLSTRLRGVFGIQDPPISLDSKARCWRAAFRVEVAD